MAGKVVERDHEVEVCCFVLSLLRPSQPQQQGVLDKAGGSVASAISQYTLDPNLMGTESATLEQHNSQTNQLSQ
jgi:hypothetical protein